MFFPRIITFFNDFAPAFAREREALAARKPNVVSIVPPSGAENVDPSLRAITVTFDRPMMDLSWSVVGGGPNFPTGDDMPSYDATRRVFILPVNLKANWTYEFGLNSDRTQIALQRAYRLSLAS